MSRRILALDIATSTGWCCGVPGERPDLGSVELAPGRSIGERGCALVDWLDDYRAFFAPWLIVYEAPLQRGEHLSVQAGRLALGLAMAVEMYGFRAGIVVREANVQQARKAVIGRGNASKADVWATCCNAGLDPPDYDASDAWLIWRFAAMLRGAVQRPTPLDLLSRGKVMA